MQFTKGAYKDAQLEKIYFAGLETYEEDMLMSTISSNLSIEHLVLNQQTILVVKIIIFLFINIYL